MAITLMCPNLRCRKILVVPEDCRGNRVRCSYCSTVFIVPWARGFDNNPFDQDDPVAVEGGKKRKK